MKTKITKLLALLAAFCGLQLFAATPVAVWNSFSTTEGLTKGDYTLHIGDGSTVTDGALVIGSKAAWITRSNNSSASAMSVEIEYSLADGAASPATELTLFSLGMISATPASSSTTIQQNLIPIAWKSATNLGQGWVQANKSPALNCSTTFNYGDAAYTPPVSGAHHTIAVTYYSANTTTTGTTTYLNGGTTPLIANSKGLRGGVVYTLYLGHRYHDTADASYSGVWTGVKIHGIKIYEALLPATDVSTSYSAAIDLGTDRLLSREVRANQTINVTLTDAEAQSGTATIQAPSLAQTTLTIAATYRGEAVTLTSTTPSTSAHTITITYEPLGAQDFTATAATGNFINQGWSPSPLNYGALNTATLSAPNAADITFSDAATLGKLTVDGAGATTFAVAYGIANPVITTYDFSGATGKTTLNYATGTSAITAGSDTVLNGTGTGLITLPANGKVTVGNQHFGSGSIDLGNGSKVVGPNTSTLVFNLGQGNSQTISGSSTDDNNRKFGVIVSSGTLKFNYTGAGSTVFKNRTVTADGQNAVVEMVYGDATGWDGGCTKIAAKNGGKILYDRRDTLKAPIELNNGTLELAAGCATSSGRALDLYGNNNWTVSGNSTLSTPSSTEADCKVLLRNGNWEVTVNDSGTFTVGAMLIANEISTSVAGGTRGKLIKKGAGTMILNAASSYETGTEVQAGTLKAEATSALGTGAVSVSSGATLELAGESSSYNFSFADRTMKGTLIIGSGATYTAVTGDSVNYDGTGDVKVHGTLNMSDKRWTYKSTNKLYTYAGATVSGTGDQHGAIDFNQGNTLYAKVSTSENKTVTISAPMKIQGNMTFDVEAGVTLGMSCAINYANSQTHTKSGAGTLELTGTPTNPGNAAWTVSAGTLKVPSGKLAGNVTLSSGATLNVTGTEGQESYVITSGTFTNNGGTVQINGQSIAEAGYGVSGNGIYRQASASRTNPVTGTEKTFNYAYVGEDGAWATTSNWRTLADGVLKPYTEANAPMLKDSNVWSPTLVDGVRFENKDVSAGAVEGWNAMLAVMGGAQVTVETLRKSGGSESEYWVGADSKLIFTAFGDQTFAKNFNFYVASAAGLTFSAELDSTHEKSSRTYNYYLKGPGSVNYAAGVTAGTHAIKQFQLVMGTGKYKIIKRQQLISFAEKSNTPTFTVANDATVSADDSTEVTKLTAAPTYSNAIGSYFTEQTADGVYVTFVGRAEQDILMWDNTNQVWKDAGGNTATPNKDSVLTVAAGDDVAFNSAVSPYSVKMPNSGTVTMRGYHNLTVSGITIPDATTLKIVFPQLSNGDITQYAINTAFAGAGTVELALAAASDYSTSMPITANNFGDSFTGGVKFSAGQFKATTALKDTIPITVVDGAQLFISSDCSGTWGNAFTISGNGYGGSSAWDRLALRFEKAFGSTATITTAAEGSYATPVIGTYFGNVEVGNTISGVGVRVYNYNTSADEDKWLIFTAPDTQFGKLSGPVEILNGIVKYGNSSSMADVDYTFGNSLAINSGAELRIWLQQNGTRRFTTPITMNGGTLKSKDGKYTFSSVTVAAESTISMAYGKTFTFTELKGSANLTLTQYNGETGTFAFSGGNYSGTITASGSANFSPSGTALKDATVILNSSSMKLVTDDTTVIKLVKMGNNACLKDNAATINAGTTLDVNDTDNTANSITLAGGKLVNNGSSGTSYGHIQTPTIDVTANSEIGGSKLLSMIASGYGATALKLNANTLTKTGANTFSLISTTVSGTGTLSINEGTVCIKRDYGSTNTTCAEGTFALNGGTLSIESSKTLTLKGLTINSGTLNNAGTLNGLAVLNGTIDFNNIGGTVGFADAVTIASGKTTLKAASVTALNGKTVTVDAGAQLDFGSERNPSGITLAGNGKVGFTLTASEVATGGNLTLFTYQDLPNTLTVVAKDVFGRSYMVTKGDSGAYTVNASDPQPTDILSVNFNSVKSDRQGKLIDNDKTAGVIAVQGINWTQLDVPNGSFTSSAAGAIIKELLADGTIDKGAMSVSYSGATAYTYGTAPSSGNGQLTYGYIDDGSNPASSSYGAEVKVENIPYSEYSVIVYIGSDGTGAIGPLTINDTVYGSPSWGERSKTHESSGVITWERNGNYLLVSGLTGSTLTVRGAKNGSPSGTRCGIAGIQVLNTGTRTLPTYTTPYSASATADSDAADLDWTDASSPAKYVAYSAVKAATANQLTVASGKTVTFDLNLSKAIGPGTFKKVGTGEVTLTQAGATKPAAIEIAGGKLTFGNGAFFNGGTDSTTFPITISAGELNLNGAYSWSSSDGSGWLTQKPITLGGTTVTKISGGNVTFYGTTITDAIVYQGGNGANEPAEFAANWHSSYSPDSRTRNISVGRGKGDGYDLKISGDIGVAGQYEKTAIIKMGEGTVLMTGTFRMPTLNINAGTWKMGSANAVAANTTIGNDGTLDLNGYTFSLATLNGTGSFKNSSDTQSTLTIGFGTKYNGSITGKIKVVVNGGTLDLTGATIGDDVTFEYNVTYTAAGCGIKLPSGKTNTITETGSSDKYKLENGIVVPKTAITKLQDTLIWLPIGDSLTEGETYMGHPDQGDINTRGGYRYQLWSQLEAMGQMTRSVGYRSGHGGGGNGTVESDDCRWAWHAAQYGGVIANDGSNNGAHGAAIFNVDNTLKVAGYPDVITVLLGVNDLSFTSDDDAGAQNVFNSLDVMVCKLAAQRPHSKILVSTLLNASGSRNYITRFNNILKAKNEANESPFNLPNVTLIDNYASCDPTKTKEGLHPNEIGAVAVAESFSGYLTAAIVDIADDKAVMVNVHNAVEGKLTVRFSKALAANVMAKITIAGTDVDGVAVEQLLEGGAVSTTDARVMEFTIPQDVVFTGGVYTATLSAVSGTAKDGTAIDTTSPASQFVEIQGTGAAANVDAKFRSGFQRYQTVSLDNGTINASGIGTGDNWAGNGPDPSQIEDGEVRSHFIKRIGYYVELRRANEPAQFMWVSMNAFDNDVTKAGIPTVLSGAHKAKVTNLQVFGNYASVANTAVANDAVVTTGEGVVEFTPWGWGGAEQSEFPNDMYSGQTGWNDTLETAAGTIAGCMQVARYTGEQNPDHFTKFTAEMLFSFNNFNRSQATDIGLGSFAVHRNNAGGGAAPTWDWANFVNTTGYKKFAVNAYEVKKIEIWVETDPAYVFNADVGANAKWSTLQWKNTSGASVELKDNAEVVLTATDAASTLEIDANVAQQVFTVVSDAAKTLTVTKTQGAQIAVNQYDFSSAAGSVDMQVATGNAKVTVGSNTKLNSNVGTLVVASGKKAVLADGVTATTYDIVAGGTLRLEGERTDGYTTVTGAINNFENGKLTIPATPSTTIRDSGTLVRVGNGDQFSIVGVGNASADAIGWNIVNEGGTVTFATTAEGKSTWIGRQGRFYRQTAGTMTAQTVVDSMSESGNQYVGFMLNYHGQPTFTFDVSGGLVDVQHAVFNYGAGNSADVILSGDAVMIAKGIRKAQPGTTVGGTFTMSDTATLRLGSCGIAAYAATFTLNGGTIVATDDTTISAALAIPGDVTFAAEATKTLTMGAALTGAGNIAVGNASATGTVKVTGDISGYTGSFAVAEGATLQLEYDARGDIRPTFDTISGNLALKVKLATKTIRGNKFTSIATLPTSTDTSKVVVTVVDDDGVEHPGLVQIDTTTGELKAKIQVEKYTYTPSSDADYTWKIGSTFDDSKTYAAYGDVWFKTTDPVYKTAVNVESAIDVTTLEMGGKYTVANSVISANEVVTAAGADVVFNNDVVATSASITTGTAKFASLATDSVTVNNSATFGAGVLGRAMKYVRLTITKVQGKELSGEAAKPAVGEFRLYRGNPTVGYTRLDWPVGTKVSDNNNASGTIGNTVTKETADYPGAVGAGKGERGGNEIQPGTLIDGYYYGVSADNPYGSSSTGNNKNKWWPTSKSGQPWIVQIEFPYPVAIFAGCNFCLADANYRNPIDWTIEVSLDGETWTTVNTTVGATWTSQNAWCAASDKPTGTAAEDWPAFVNNVAPTVVNVNNATVIADGSWSAALNASGNITFKGVAGKKLTLDKASTSSFADGATLTFDLTDYSVDEAGKQYVVAGPTTGWPTVDKITVVPAGKFILGVDDFGYYATVQSGTFWIGGEGTWNLKDAPMWGQTTDATTGYIWLNGAQANFTKSGEVTIADGVNAAAINLAGNGINVSLAGATGCIASTPINVTGTGATLAIANTDTLTLGTMTINDNAAFNFTKTGAGALTLPSGMLDLKGGKFSISEGTVTGGNFTSATFEKTGTGEATLKVAKSGDVYSHPGTATISDGTLIIGTNADDNSYKFQATSIAIENGATLDVRSRDAIFNVPSITVAAGGKLTTSGFNQINQLTLNGGTLESVAGWHDGYMSWCLGGGEASFIKATGNTTSFITTGATPGERYGVQLATGIFIVDDGSTLEVSTPMQNGPGDRGTLQNQVRKTGTGTMIVKTTPTYTGITDVQEGTYILDCEISGKTYQVASGATLNIGTNHGLTISGEGNVEVKLTDAEVESGSVTLFTAGDTTPTVSKVLWGETDITSKCVVTDGVLTFKESESEAKADGLYFLALEDAIKTAAEGSTVTLLKNVELSNTVLVEKNLSIAGGAYELSGGTLSVNDGKTITIESGLISITDFAGFGTYSLIGGRYAEAKKTKWSAASGYHYVEIAGTTNPKYFQIVKGEEPVSGAEQKAYPLVVGDVPTGTVALNAAQLNKIGCTKDSTVAEVAAALATTQSNDLTKYENLVLGLDGTKTEVKDIPVVAPVQGTSTTQISFKLGDNVKVDESTGAKVTYKVMSKGASGKYEYEQGEWKHDATAQVALPESGVKYYKLDVIVTPAK